MTQPFLNFLGWELFKNLWSRLRFVNLESSPLFIRSLYKAFNVVYKRVPHQGVLDNKNYKSKKGVQFKIDLFTSWWTRHESSCPLCGGPFFERIYRLVVRSRLCSMLVEDTVIMHIASGPGATYPAIGAARIFDFLHVHVRSCPYLNTNTEGAWVQQSVVSIPSPQYCSYCRWSGVL